MKSWNGKNYVWMWILQRQLRYFIQRLNTTSTRYLIAASNICNRSVCFFKKSLIFLATLLDLRRNEITFPCWTCFLFWFLICKSKIHECRCQCHTDNSWWRERWQRPVRALGWKLFATETLVAPTHNKQIPGDWLARVNFKHHIKGVWRQNTIWGAVPLAVITLWPRYNSLHWPQDFLYLPFGFHPFPLGDLWHQRSQEMPWSLGNVQLYA